MRRARSWTRRARWTEPWTWWWRGTPTRGSTSRWTASSWSRRCPTGSHSTACRSRSTAPPATSSFVMPTRHAGVKPDPSLAALVESYRRRIAPLANRVVGHAAQDLDNAAVDRLAVDAQRAFAGADIAFLNPGNTRSELDAGPITYSEAFEVQAYEHPVWRLHMTGADLQAAMAEQPGLLVSGPT